MPPHLAELGDAKDALAAAQAEYDKYHPKAEPQAKPQVTQAAAKAPAAKKKAASGALAQTGDNSALAGEVFVIGGITLVAAGVTLERSSSQADVAYSSAGLCDDTAIRREARLR